MDFSFTTVLIVILLIIIVYFIWNMLSSSSSTTSTDTSILKTETMLKVTGGNTFSFSTWLAINTWGNGGGNIIKTPATGTPPTSDFSLTLGTNSNDLIFSYKVLGPDLALKQYTVKLPNMVPLQTWASIIISVNNGYSADIYINGKLVQSVALQGLYTLPTASVTVGGGSDVDGYISTTFSATSTGPQDAWNIYSSGFGSGSGGVTDFFNKYKVRFAFVKDNVELSRLDI